MVWGFNSEGDKIGISVFNSEINPQKIKKKELRALHLFFSGDNDFLDHDSYLDCSEIREVNADELIRKLEEDPGCYLGCVLPGDLKKAEDCIRSAKTISFRLKKTYGLV